MFPAVVETIRNPVTEQFLLDFIHQQGFKKPDSQLMPPPHGNLSTKNQQHHQHHHPQAPPSHSTTSNPREQDDYMEQTGKRQRML